MVNLDTKDHIIFDLDGTITTLSIDWVPWRKKIRELINQLDPTFDIDSVANLAVAQNEVIKRKGERARQVLWSYNKEHETDFLTGHQTNQSVVNFIKNTTTPISLWTSNSRPTAQNVLSDLNLDHKFSLFVTRDEVAHIKPEVDGFEQIHSQIKLNLNQYAFVGDSILDEQAAEKIGIDFIHISHFA